MAVPHSTSIPPSEFPQDPEDSVHHTVRRVRQVWPASIAEDQAAIEQARKELGSEADPKDVLARAQQIKKEGNRGL